MTSHASTKPATSRTAPGNAAGPLAADAPEFDVALGRFDRTPVIAEVRSLSVVSNGRGALAISVQWAWIVAAVAAAISSGHWLVWALAIVVIASRQQALGILMHDGAHYLLFTNRTVNDFVSDLFCAFPLGLSTTMYRATHFKHHRFVSTPNDPDWSLQQQDRDWRFPKSRWEAAKLIVLSALGLNLLKGYQALKQWSPSLNLFSPLSKDLTLGARVLFVAGSIATYALIIATRTWWEAIFLWVVPSVTLVNLFNRVRAASEHIGTPGSHELNSTRTILPTWWERLMISPCGINYHIEHHVFPSVPARNLRKLHEILMQRPEYRERAHITPSYWHPRHGVLGELLARRDT